MDDLAAAPAPAALPYHGPPLLARLLEHALALGASRLRLHAGDGRVAVWARVDGVEHAIASLEGSAAPDLFQACAHHAGSPGVPARRALGPDQAVAGLTACRLQGADGAVHAVITLPAAPVLRRLDALGFDPPDLAPLRRALAAPGGLVVVAGPPESGRSSALLALAHEAGQLGRRVVALAPSAPQRAGSGCHFALPRGARARSRLVVRAAALAPEVLMVDHDLTRPDWARLGAAVESGTVVLACLRAGRIAAALNRLVGVGATPAALAEHLLALLHVRLVRRLCPHCALEDASAETRRVLAHALNAWLALERIEARRARPGGCPPCRGTGYLGRLPLYEVAAVDAAVRAQLESGRLGTETEHLLLGPGRSLWDGGLRRLAQGRTSLAALRAAVAEPL